MSQTRQSNPDKPGYRCERCWSEEHINLHPKSDFLGGNAKGFIILCERCRSEAPKGEGKEDEFENLFLKFASPKEFMQHHHVTSEREAMEKWREKSGQHVSSDIVEQVGDSDEGDVVDEVESADAPFGYELINGTLQIINDDADIIRNIYDRYMAGQTMESIARTLAKKIISTGTGWNVGMVRDILKNPIYAGYDFMGGEVKRAGHTPIIERNRFNSVQERIQRNIRNPRYRAKPLILGD